MGLNSSLSSPTSEQGCKKGGGGGGHCHYSKMSSSFLVPSNLPAYQAVVIQLLSIG